RSPSALSTPTKSASLCSSTTFPSIGLPHSPIYIKYQPKEPPPPPPYREQSQIHCTTPFLPSQSTPAAPPSFQIAPAISRKQRC
ncbi:hypothetical protein Ancab_016647, partial [Ancistrocladus abbreviatus]